MAVKSLGPFDFGPSYGALAQSGPSTPKAPEPMGIVRDWKGDPIVTDKKGKKRVAIRPGTPLEPGQYSDYDPWMDENFKEWLRSQDNNPEDDYEPWFDDFLTGGGYRRGGGIYPFIIGSDPDDSNNQVGDEPGSWDRSLANDKEKQDKVRRAFQIISEDYVKCFNWLFPGLGHCIVDAYKQSIILIDNSVPTMRVAGATGHTSVGINEVMWATSDRVFAKELFHELVHICLVALGGSYLTELDAQVLEILCEPQYSTTPEEDEYFKNKPALLVFIDKLLPAKNADLWYSALFIWDPATGEIWQNYGGEGNEPVKGPKLFPVCPTCPSPFLPKDKSLVEYLKELRERLL